MIVAALLIAMGAPSVGAISVGPVLDWIVDADRASSSRRSRAAARLSAVGARPLSDTEDLAMRWAGRQQPPPVTRDRVLGPAYRIVSLSPQRMIAVEQTFYAGRRAEVAAAGLDRAKFDLNVMADETAPTCRRTSHRVHCVWVPFYSGAAKIRLTNKGTRTARFVIVLN